MGPSLQAGCARDWILGNLGEAHLSWKTGLLLLLDDHLQSRAMPLLIDLSPAEAVDQRVQAKVRECFAEFGAVHLDAAGDSMQVHIPNQALHRLILEDGVLDAWRRMRQHYDQLGRALEGQAELRLRLIRAADQSVEDERPLRRHGDATGL